MNVIVKCIICRSEMVRRKNRSNGNVFYGCSKYPDCTYTMTMRTFRQKEHEEGCSIIGEDPYFYDF